MIHVIVTRCNHLIEKRIPENAPENQYRGKVTRRFSGPKCSNALRNTRNRFRELYGEGGFRARKVFGSFEKRTEQRSLSTIQTAVTEAVSDTVFLNEEVIHRPFLLLLKKNKD